MVLGITPHASARSRSPYLSSVSSVASVFNLGLISQLFGLCGELCSEDLFVDRQSGFAGRHRRRWRTGVSPAPRDPAPFQGPVPVCGRGGGDSRLLVFTEGRDAENTDP